MRTSNYRAGGDGQWLYPASGPHNRADLPHRFKIGRIQIL